MGESTLKQFIEVINQIYHRHNFLSQTDDQPAVTEVTEVTEQPAAGAEGEAKPAEEKKEEEPKEKKEEEPKEEEKKKEPKPKVEKPPPDFRTVKAGWIERPGMD